MFGFLFKKIFGSKNERYLRRLRPQVQRINALEPEMQQLDDADFAARIARYKEEVQEGGKNLDSLLPEVFALVREASRRVLGMRHYDVQLVGGMVLHKGKIAEMKTGEGKTLMATLPAYLNALTGKGVDSLKAAIATKVHELREEARAKAAEQPEFDHVWEHKREMRDRRFTVRKLSDGVFRVEGGQVERMVIQTDWENEDAIAFLQHRFKRIGVEDALAKAGARNGDEIRIVGRAFEFESATADDAFEELDI